MADFLEKLYQAKESIKRVNPDVPEIGIILGSGLGDFVHNMEESSEIPYNEILNFPKVTVEGHEGKLVMGTVNQKQVIACMGRFHLYEGYKEEVVFPIYLLKMLGVKVVIVTNACGGLNPVYQPGDLMVISDHINATGFNPLMGPNLDMLGPRFPDMSHAYDPELRELTLKVGNKLNILLHEGVYVGQTGPAYSTPSEYKMFKMMGADVIGMSTVPEVIVSNYLGMKVVGISCITDTIAEENVEPLTHEEVVRVANQTKPKFIRLIKGVMDEVQVHEYS